MGTGRAGAGPPKENFLGDDEPCFSPPPSEAAAAPAAFASLVLASVFFAEPPNVDDEPKEKPPGAGGAEEEAPLEPPFLSFPFAGAAPPPAAPGVEPNTNPPAGFEAESFFASAEGAC